MKQIDFIFDLIILRLYSFKPTFLQRILNVGAVLEPEVVGLLKVRKQSKTVRGGFAPAIYSCLRTTQVLPPIGRDERTTIVLPDWVRLTHL